VTYYRPLRSNSNPVVSVYALVDPVDGTVRYIGRTRDTKQRLTGHLCARPSSNRRRYKWIRELKKRGLVPRVVVLERCKLRKAPAAEEQWIQLPQAQRNAFQWHR
jgi:hypothetical protein